MVVIVLFEGIVFFKGSTKRDIQSIGLFTLPDPDADPYSDSDSCTMQKFQIGSDSDSDPLIEMYVVGKEIFP